jgi:hypothetical protein
MVHDLLRDLTKAVPIAPAKSDLEAIDQSVDLWILGPDYRVDGAFDVPSMPG